METIPKETCVNGMELTLLKREKDYALYELKGKSGAKYGYELHHIQYQKYNEVNMKGRLVVFEEKEMLCATGDFGEHGWHIIPLERAMEAFKNKVKASKWVGWGMPEA